MSPARWVVRGFQGCVQMLEEWVSAGNVIDPTTAQNLRHWVKRLSALVGEDTAPSEAPTPSDEKLPRRWRSQ